MSINIFGFRICPLDLITDARTGKLSTAKLWQHVGNGIMCHVMLKQDQMTPELLLSFGAVVSGSYVAINFLKWRYRDSKSIETTLVNEK